MRRRRFVLAIESHVEELHSYANDDNSFSFFGSMKDDGCLADQLHCLIKRSLIFNSMQTTSTGSDQSISFFDFF